MKLRRKQLPISRIVTGTPIAGILIAAGILTSTVAPATAGATQGQWSIVPTLGVSQLTDQKTTISGSPDIDGGYSLETDTGFTAGLGIRYRYNTQWQAEFAWEYRSNDSTLRNDNGDTLSGGNYASNIFFINGRRYFDLGKPWQPYLGAGLQVVQEIDVDYEGDSGERSFEDGGMVGLQLMTGIDLPLGDRFTLGAEIRYGSLSGMRLNSEESTGTIGELDYRPLTAQISIGLNL